MNKSQGFKKLEKRILRKIGNLNREYNLIRPGDNVVLGVSGGKDSLALSVLLQKLKERAPFVFNFSALTLDTGLSSDSKDALKKFMSSYNIDFRIQETNIRSTVESVVPEGKQPCSACSRFRRGILYDYAWENRAVLALGHHGDDAVETLLMNIFFTGKIQSMPPVLVSDDKRNRLIRPMLYVREFELAEYASAIDAPVVSGCNCPGVDFLESGQRAFMKKLVSDFELSYPDTANHLIKSLSNIKSSNMMDQGLWDFSGLTASWESENPKIIWKETVRNFNSTSMGKKLLEKDES
ncbi:MAG: tRNA 2-thiocytidine(32) synthetase TtcA [Deltaproteobacteria bacterium]|nr:tRNA 2-thiocytidine(32) synthetase TtcA [Deltaproteobacteria bacterium]